MKVTTVGIDLAKNVFTVYGVDEHAKTALRKTVRRAKLLGLGPKRGSLDCPGAIRKVRLALSDLDSIAVRIADVAARLEAMSIGLFAPPFGIGFYAACAIGKVAPERVVGHMWRYLLVLIAALVVIAIVL